MKRYSKEIKDFIADNVKGTTTKDLVEITNNKFGTDFTESSMKSYKTNHKLKSETHKGNPCGTLVNYTSEIQKFILDNVKGIEITELTNLINQKFDTNYRKSQIHSFVNNRGLKSGLDFRFEKGHIPHNKGKEKYWIGGEETQFKKGHIPHNHKPIGTERITKDGYIEIKITDPNKWRGKHILVWEKQNGPLPKSHVVIFGDRDKRNFNINNLILVSRQQLAVLNKHKLIQTNTDSTRTGVIIANLYKKINDRKIKKVRM